MCALYTSNIVYIRTACRFDITSDNLALSDIFDRCPKNW